VGCIFHWGKAKDPASTIEVMKIIKQRMPDVPRYMFSSGRRPAGTKGIHYRRLPSIEQTREIYSKCKVWFLTSISEGFGNPILEAMACGCAVVSTDCGGPHDIIKHGENGFLVDVGNTQAIAEKTTRLLKDDQLRKKIRANAMKTAQQYSWPKAAAELEKLLYSIYESKRKDIPISKEHV
jgi:glycosyltransferase involved in cell wall biosynthesis